MAIKKGYTLIELIIVVGLVSILSIGISSAVLINATTATRTKNITNLRAAGGYSLNTIKQLIRSSRSITACDSDTISLQNQDGATTTISLELDNSVNRIASNSGIYLTPDDISIVNFTITCLPNNAEPTLIKLSFDTELATPTTTKESPTLHFSTSVTPRSN